MYGKNHYNLKKNPYLSLIFYMQFNMLFFKKENGQNLST